MNMVSRIDVALEMESSGLMPLFYHDDAELAKNVVKSLYNGGARLFEFTHRGPKAAEVFQEIVALCSKSYPEMIVGAGSIPDAATAAQYMNMGAQFIVTPVLREDIARICNRRKVLWLPGCGSLTEIAHAEELGCEIVKLFPAEVYGPEFIQAVKGPQPWTKIMPTGGVTTDLASLQSWFKAGAVCVGMGSKLISKDILANKDFQGLEKLTAQTLSNIQKIKNT